jgi:hypothetical protein
MDRIRPGGQLVRLNVPAFRKAIRDDGSVGSRGSKLRRLDSLFHMPRVVVISEPRVFSVTTSFTVVLRRGLPVHL